MIHLPLFYFLINFYFSQSPAIGYHGFTATIGLLALVFAVAAMFNWAIERPFLKLKQRLSAQPAEETISSITVPWMTMISVGLILSGVMFSYLQ